MIVINVDVMLAKRKMSVTELTERVGLTMANVSLLKNGKVKAIKISTLEKFCQALDCQPGDLLEYRRDVQAQELGNGDRGGNGGTVGRMDGADGSRRIDSGGNRGNGPRRD
jgi:putative transcriptional regulator